MSLTLQSCGQDTEGLNEAMRKAIARNEVISVNLLCSVPAVSIFPGSRVRFDNMWREM